MPAALAAASISAPFTWPGSSSSGRLLMMTVTPCALACSTSATLICGETRMLGVSWRNIGGTPLRPPLRFGAAGFKREGSGEGSDGGQEGIAIGVELALADAADVAEFGQGRGALLRQDRKSTR